MSSSRGGLRLPPASGDRELHELVEVVGQRRGLEAERAGMGVVEPCPDGKYGK
jgi:hypothetical protein